MTKLIDSTLARQAPERPKQAAPQRPKVSSLGMFGSSNAQQAKPVSDKADEMKVSPRKP